MFGTARTLRSETACPSGWRGRRACPYPDLALLLLNRGLIDHYEWNPRKPARLILIDLESGAVSKHETEPFFCLHTVHAFETPEATVLDVVAYDDASVLHGLTVERWSKAFPRIVRSSCD